MGNDIGQIGAKRITTGRLYFKPSGGSYELDLGNVVKFKRNDKTETVVHMASANGIRRIDDETVHTVGYGYIFTLDEYTDQVIAALQKAGVSVPIATTSVSAVSSGTASISSAVIGATYSVGQTNLLTLTVSVGGSAKTAGVDYIADLGAGRFTVLQGGSIASAAALSITFTSPAYKIKAVASATLPTLRGTFSFYETDQLSSLIRAEHLFSGTAWITGDSEEQTTGFRTVDLNVTATTAPTINERV